MKISVDEFEPWLMPWPSVMGEDSSPFHLMVHGGSDVGVEAIEEASPQVVTDPLFIQIVDDRGMVYNVECFGGIHKCCVHMSNQVFDIWIL